MLTISELAKAYGPRTLFDEVSMQINREDRIGLVGPNGAGKSTLFSIILGQEAPDSGSIVMEKNVVLGHLPQESAPAGNQTVLELAIAITPEIAELQRHLKSDEAGHDNIHAQYDDLGGYQLEPRARRILAGLSFREKDFDRPLRELSGGWVMRAHLARLLTLQPDLLMLDEPTNHLDLESLQWFQEYLRGYPGAILMISHDRNFLNQLCGHIIDIRQGRLTRYRGNYNDYLAQREAADVQLLAAYKNQQREIAHKMEFVERFRAKNTKAAQAQSKLKQIERMEKIEAPASEQKKIAFHFPHPQRSGLKVITLKDVRHAYGQNVVYTGVDFEAQRGQRIVLVGPNGAGKSTLLKLLAGVIEPQAGLRELGHNVKHGYYSQYRVDMLQPERTVMEEGLDTPERVTEQFIRTALGSFLFRGDDVFKKVGVLSGGEKSRLALVKLLLNPPNLLLMDEPTTHLDMSSIDALINALEHFAGTLIFISHDVYFIERVSNHVVRVADGKLTHYLGGYQYYLEKSAADAARLAPVAAPRPAKAVDEPSRKDRKRAEAQERDARARERRAREAAVKKIEADIARLETRQKEISAELEKPETYQKPGAGAELNREWKWNDDELQTLTAEWEAATAELTA